MKAILTISLPIILLAQIGGASSPKENDTYISETAQDACYEYGEQYNISPELLVAIIETESEGNPRAETGGCKGLMQIYIKYHRDRMKRLGVEDIFDERSNVLVGTDYLAELFEKYHEASYVLDVYNGNSKAKSNYENGTISPYAKKILERSAELEFLHGK